MAWRSLLSSTIWLMPFRYYNDLLERRPLVTKSITSGLMYAGGDLLAQYAEHHLENQLKPLSEQKPIEINKKRAFTFLVFGTFVGGPSYHYWFNYLNELPVLLWRMKQSRHRGQIIRAYTLLRSYNIDVKLDLAKLPQAAPLTKWKGKVAKILADQLIFSSCYTLVFFMAIGMLSGAMDRLDVENRVTAEFLQAIQSNKNSVNNMNNMNNSTDMKKYDDNINESLLAIYISIQKLFTSSRKEDKLDSDNPSRFPLTPLDEFISYFNLGGLILRQAASQQALQNAHLTWQEIWRRSSQHCKEVYVETYLTDCAVWPLLQLVNFSFVPLKFQFLFVNMANLGWNTFLSLMANNKHNEGEGEGKDGKK